MRARDSRGDEDVGRPGPRALHGHARPGHWRLVGGLAPAPAESSADGAPSSGTRRGPRFARWFRGGGRGTLVDGVGAPCASRLSSGSFAAWSRAASSPRPAARAEPWFDAGQDALEDAVRRRRSRRGRPRGPAARRPPRARRDVHGASWVSVVGFERELLSGQRDVGGMSRGPRPRPDRGRPRAPDRRSARGPPATPATTAPPPERRGSPRRPPAGAQVRRRGVAHRRASGPTTRASTPCRAFAGQRARSRRRACAPCASGTTRRTRRPSRPPTTRATTTPSAPTWSSSCGSPGASIGSSTRATSRPSSGSASSGKTRGRASPPATLEALFAWQRARRRERGRRRPARRSRSSADLRAAEAEATLDVLTGGWFSASQAAARQAIRRGAAALTRRERPPRYP